MREREKRVTRPHRKLLKRREHAGDIRFMTFSCYRRLPLMNHPAIRDLFIETLAQARRKFAFSLYAAVVMPEHAHVILLPAKGGTWKEVGLSMKTSIGRRVVGRWRELHAPILKRLRSADGRFHFWQAGGGFDRNIRDTEELLREIGYTHRNPVRRGLVKEPEEWKWSTIHWWNSNRDGTLECDVPPGDPRAWAMWKGYR